MLLKCLFLTISALRNTSGFTAQVTQVVKFRTTDTSEASNFNFSDTRRVQWESTFHTDTIGNFADSIHLADSGTATFDDYTFKKLDTFSGSFYDPGVDTNSVSRTEFWNIRTQL